MLSVSVASGPCSSDDVASLSVDAVCRINNHLEVVNHILSLIDTTLLPHQAKLREFVQIGQAAVHCIADALAGRQEELSYHVATDTVDA
jgi:hypothetical protein